MFDCSFVVKAACFCRQSFRNFAGSIPRGGLTTLPLILGTVIFISPPAALTAQIKLAWNPNTESNLAGYKVYYGTNPRTYSAVINVGNVTTYTLTGLVAGEMYYIAVTAFDTSVPPNESAYSNEVSGVATNLGITPAAPTLSSPSSGATGIPTNPTLTWNASTRATSYRVQVSTSSGFTSTVVDRSGITATSYGISGLLNNIRYYWCVNATNSGGTGAWSSVRYFTTVAALPPAPPAPTLSSPSNGATRIATSPTLTWNASTGATSYRVQVSTSSGFTSTVVDRSGITATSCSISGLLNKTRHYWRVNATNSGGTSGWSSVRYFTTAAAARLACCDFNEDVSPDPVRRNKVTGLSSLGDVGGVAMTQRNGHPPMLDHGWEIVGIGDFNIDGNPDLVWRNKINGLSKVWFMNGTIMTNWDWLPQVADPEWEIVGIGHFNTDGNPDLVWRSKATGLCAVCYMQGTTMTDCALFAYLLDMDWEIKGVVDLNGDGNSDIIWGKKTTGESMVWLLDGVTIRDWIWVSGGH